MRWNVHIRELQTYLRVGIHPHEMLPQRVLVSAEVEGDYPAYPASIADCFDYDHVHDYVVHEWPKRNHTALLESYVADLLAHIFRMDMRVTLASVCVSKPDIFAEAQSVGVEARWTRQEFEQMSKNTP